MRKIGIYGGTFDPIHHAHLILAREALEKLQLEQVIFVPAAVSPHKEEAGSAAAVVRLAMVKAAIADEPRFAVDDLELRRPAPSFTFDTVQVMRARFENAQLLYLVGDDNVEGLPTWHRFKELERLVEFVVLERIGLDTHHPYPTLGRRIDISATDIRKRVAAGASIAYLVPPPVEAIIRANGLYKEQQTSPKKI